MKTFLLAICVLIFSVCVGCALFEPDESGTSPAGVGMARAEERLEQTDPGSSPAEMIYWAAGGLVTGIAGTITEYLRRKRAQAKLENAVKKVVSNGS